VDIGYISTRAGVLRLVMPGTPDEVRIVWFPIQNKLRKCTSAFVLLIENKVHTTTNVVLVLHHAVSVPLKLPSGRIFQSSHLINAVCI
jgi:hypothetical protein